MARRRATGFALSLALATWTVLGAVPGLAQEAVRVGSTPTAVPFTFLNTKTNQMEGLMVDVIEAIGKDAGFSVKVEPMQFSALIGSLTSNRIDLISAAMYATETRKRTIDFSDAVYSYGDGLFVLKSDTTDYKEMPDLKGAAVGAQIGTAFVEPLQKSGLFTEVKLYDSIPDLMRDVNAGRIKAGFADAPIVAYNLQQGRFPEVRLVKGYKPMLMGSVGIGVRKTDPDLLKRVDAALARMKADGTLAKILTKWGLGD